MSSLSPYHICLTMIVRGVDPWAEPKTYCSRDLLAQMIEHEASGTEPSAFQEENSRVIWKAGLNPEKADP